MSTQDEGPSFAATSGGAQQAYGAPQPPQPPYSGAAYPPPGYAGPGYPGAYGYGYVPQPPTNTMAILALIFAFVFAPAGIVLGALSLKQIKQTGEGGHGMALAGLICGIVFTVISALLIVLIFAVAASVTSNLPNDYSTPSTMLALAGQFLRG